MSSAQNQIPTICTPIDVDVLCGKTSTNCHPGNVYFRELVLSKIDNYMSASKKCQKGQVVLEIMTTLETIGTRFLKLDKKSNEWHVIKPSEAREKVSHSIRDRVRDRKKGKVVLPSQDILSSPPKFSTKEASLVTKRSKKRIKKSTNSNTKVTACKVKSNLVVSRKKFVMKSTLKRIKVVSGDQDLATLETSLQHRPISVISDNESEAVVSSSSISSVLGDDISISCSVSSSGQDSTISEYLGCESENPSPKPCTISLPLKLNLPSTITMPVGPIIAHMDSCDTSMLFEEESLADPLLVVSVEKHFEDDSSALLDDYSDLFESDDSTDQDESDFVVSMLQEACAVMFD